MLWQWFYKNKRSIETGDIPLFYDIGVVDVDNDQEKIVVDLDLFGRATPTEFDANQVKEL